MKRRGKPLDELRHGEWCVTDRGGFATRDGDMILRWFPPKKEPRCWFHMQGCHWSPLNPTPKIDDGVAQTLEEAPEWLKEWRDD